MTDQRSGKHAFISYVREDSGQIDRLCRILDAAKIPHWRDRTALGPGDMWRSKIRDAIKSDSLAFIACFSTQSGNKPKSFQNEELTLAIEEFRLRPPGRTYLIPVRLDDCEIPAWELGAGQMLGDVNYIDLFGDGYAENAVKLVEAIKRVMGLETIDPAIVRTAVGEATAEDRPRLLRDLTKQMIRDPAREIELDELVTQEVSRVLTGMRDTGRFPEQFTGGTQDELTVLLAETATKYWELVEPFCWSLQVASRWGSPETLSPWVKGMRALSAEALKPRGGTTVLLDLCHIPVLVSVMVAALASTGQGRWDNFKALLVDNMVSDRGYEGKRVAIIESVTPWDPFGYGEITAHVLARSATSDDDFPSAVTGFDRKYGKFHTPAAEWMFALLTEMFAEQFPDADAYQSAFDYAEVVLGVVNEDLGNVKDTGEGRPLRFRNTWFGRSTWRYSHRHCDPVTDLADEHAASGSVWKPLQAGLFGGAADRAAIAIQQYGENFKDIARRHW
ncbi:hypothetical protein A5745_12710 [Mycobacterium sp. IS-2888]|uniref:toll/interleukin-1 receptor domain-containing protein n=1 Tax=Mycobacterium sp. IS-2888 TaxID=1834159 RepID=UPI00096F1FF6|nr:toll/interleukin-1 receptor domain-containing protein [Mycobacterium sp. IS-2888]OMC46346.1 hypothetical protein A5745_12710 [Mycobacterium sp. IS-2888]